MKIFLDTAEIEPIEKYAHIIDGITTNPTNLAREKKNPTHLVQHLCKILAGKEVSVEITEQESAVVYDQAKKIAAMADNVVVKIPCHESYYALIKQLVTEKIKINITLVFTLAQAVLMAKLGVKYISPFVGRWNDSGMDGTPLLYQIRSVIDRYNFSSQVLAASLRDVVQVEQAMLAGCHAGTVSVELFKKMIAHPLTQQGMERFDHDWKKLSVSKFPE